uniref:Alpha putative n=1 Tax=Albugo laibachii Nc14 TaxID=890382 RepID=F0W5L3_9STRA|nr:alpha putative [Albugo laibachii Nc14]|eukprot:CCA16404.1 alpha putative [Albugo laibachii Nc14]
MEKTRTFVVSYRLPIYLRRTESTKQHTETTANVSKWQVEWTSDRIMNTLMESPSRYQSHFVGRLPSAWDAIALTKEEQSELETLLRHSYHCFPVFMDESSLQDSLETLFEAYCKQTLWPVFHNVVDLYSPLQVITEQEAPEHKEMGQSLTQSFWTPSSQQSTWQAYINMNQRFAQVLIAIYDSMIDISANEQSFSKHSIIWIQDYELCLLPSHLMRKKKHRSIKIGIFFHVPFPSSEVFRTLSTRKKLLTGILNADHVGFHFFDPLAKGQFGIEYAGRQISVTCCHMGISINRIDTALQTDNVRNHVILLRQQHPGCKIIAGCDTIERLKGIPLKFLAFDKLLERCSELIGNVVLIQKGIHQRGRWTDYMQSKKEIEHVVDIINTKYRSQANRDVIEYEEVEEFTFHQRIALWRVADVQLITVLREGYNPSPLEFIVTHKGSAGVVILSEFAGSSRVLSGALIVNPWECDQLVDALRHALYISSKERDYRRDCDYQFIHSQSPERWINCILTDILNAEENIQDPQAYFSTGFGLDVRFMKMSAGFRKLTDSILVPAYRSSKTRAIFLDYYRTITPDVSKVLGVQWPDVPLTALSTLEHLCRDPRNTVFIVSGCDCEILTERFGSVPGLGLVAEHGYYIRQAPLGSSARLVRPWKCHGDVFQVASCNQLWREKAQRTIQLYVDRTNGSSVEFRKSAVLFRYAKSDSEFGAIQATELKQHLEQLFEKWPLSVIRGKDYIEVRLASVGKGNIVGYILEKMRSDGNAPDIIFCAGDDVADELMFKRVEDWTGSGNLQKDNAFTCTVGRKPSKAKYFVDDYTDVIDLLKSLCVSSTKSNRNYSLSDMQMLAQRDPKAAMSLVQKKPLADPTHRSSRFVINQHLAPVIEEDQLIAHEAWPLFAITRSRRSKRRRVVVPLAVILVVLAIFRYRRHEDVWSRAKYVFSLLWTTKARANEWHFDGI